MSNIIKYVRNRNPLSSNHDDSSSSTIVESSNTPYLNLEESVSADINTQYGGAGDSSNHISATASSDQSNHATATAASEHPNQSLIFFKIHLHLFICFSSISLRNF